MSDSKNPTAIDCVQISEETLRHRRVLPDLVASLRNTWHREPRERRAVHTWDASVVALTDPPDYDGSDWLVVEPASDGDVESALRRLVASAVEAMTNDAQPMYLDAAPALRGRILAVVRNSPRGPVVTRLDAGFSGDDPRGDGDVWRTRWVSTTETRATAEGAFRSGSTHLSPWLSSVTALIDGPDMYRARRLPAQVFRDGDLEGGLAAAITLSCEAMMPSSDRPPLDPEHPEPLDCDVALAVAGRIHAVVQWTEDGPVVCRFADLWPGLV